jgi:excisionase family DNA binding protein
VFDNNGHLTTMKLTTLPSAPETTELLTPAELARRWKVSLMFLWRARRDGKLPAHKLGKKHIRFSLADIREIEARNRIAQ